MAPEQVRQQPSDGRSDVFSLGVVLYELLTDVKPFRGGSLAEITRAVLEHEPPRADMANRAVPPGLAAIVAKAMAKDPGQRYPSAGALARELRRWLDEHEDVAAPPVPPPPAPERRVLLRGARLAWASALAATVLALLAAVGWYLARWR